MARKRVNTTKYEIIQTATSLFLEQGYSKTPPKLICDTLELSTGNLTYYFPTKEHLLAVLTEMLCGYQGKLMQEMVQEGATSLLAVCLELATMTAACEEDPIARDLFLSCYCSPMSLAIIRKSDTQRSKTVYGEFCPGWTEEQFVEAGILVSGIEYATLTAAGDPVPLQLRITGALDNIMRIYNVPEDIRRDKIGKVLSLDYRSLSREILNKFKQYVYETNEQAFEALLGSADE